MAMMTRDEAVGLLTTHVKNERMLNHCYAAEAVMRLWPEGWARMRRNGPWRDSSMTST